MKHVANSHVVIEYVQGTNNDSPDDLLLLQAGSVNTGKKPTVVGNRYVREKFMVAIQPLFPEAKMLNKHCDTKWDHPGSKARGHKTKTVTRKTSAGIAQNI
jgi:hypothetical protein